MSLGPYSRAGLALVFVPLYLGPLLAGWSRLPVATLPVFALAFLLFIAATRRPDLRQPAGIAALVMMGAVQAVLVGVCFGLGLGLATLTAPLALPVWLPVALTALAAGIGAWRYSDTAEMDVFLDSAIAEIGEMNDRTPADWDDIHPPPDAASHDAVERTLAALRALPRDAKPAHLDPIVQDLEQETGANGFDAFYDAAGAVDGVEDPRIDRGLLRYVASPFVRRQLVDRGEGGLAPMLLLNAEAPGTRYEARAILLTLFDEEAPLTQLPDPGWLDELHEMFPDEGYDEIAALRRARMAR